VSEHYLRTLAAKLYAALLVTQLSSRDIDGHAQCPECHGDEWIGHLQGCSIGDVITEAASVFEEPEL
jgi:hypothetical protein